VFLYAKLLIYEFISFLNMHVTFTTEGCDFTFDFEKKNVSIVLCTRVVIFIFIFVLTQYL